MFDGTFLVLWLNYVAVISSDQDETLWLELHLPKTKQIIIGNVNDHQDNEFENNSCKLTSDCDILKHNR